MGRAAGQASYFLSKFCLSASLSGAGSGSEREMGGLRQKPLQLDSRTGVGAGSLLETQSYKPRVEQGGDSGEAEQEDRERPETILSQERKSSQKRGEEPPALYKGQRQ